MKIFRLFEYHVSYKGAAGKAFSAYMPTLKWMNCIFRVNHLTAL
jgi:hypothetical protein